MKKDPMSRQIAPRWGGLSNLRMAEKLTSGECVDLSSCKRTKEGDYILTQFTEGVDYCDADTENWIWSIGCNNKTGKILASTSAKFYDNPSFVCLWLR